MTRVNLEELERRGVVFNDEQINTIDMLENKKMMNGVYGYFYITSNGSQIFIPNDVRDKIIDELNSLDNS